MTTDRDKFIFNYIITIHNKESLIEEVLNGIINCVGEYSNIYPVLDGCTDRTETIVDSIIKSNPTIPINKVYADDVHELLAINAGLKAASQEGKGYNIILQDDVILKDKDLERKIIELYKNQESLGIVSFRHGGDISRSLLKLSRHISPIINYTESVNGHDINHAKPLPLNSFTYREVAIKSPICIPFDVIQNVGMPDERFAPWDDLAYCYKVSHAGYNNGVYALDIHSDIAWGTTRLKKQKNTISEVELKNLQLFKELFNPQFSEEKRRRIYDTKIYSYTSESPSNGTRKQLRYLFYRQKLLIKNLISLLIYS